MPIQKSAYDIEARKIFLYGKPKTGKSTFASHMKGAYFVSTEAGLDFLKTKNTVIRSWPDFIKFLGRIEAKPELIESSRCFIVDTVDRLYTLCYAHVMKELNIREPRQNNYGKDWKILRNEWEANVNRLLTLGKGVLFIGHCKEIEVSIEDEALKDVTVPGYISAIPMSGREFILTTVDFAWCADQVTQTEKVDGKKTKKTRPYIFTKPSDRYPDCGFRLDIFPEKVPLNYKDITAVYNTGIKKVLSERGIV